MKRIFVSVCLAGVLFPVTVMAQDNGMSEVIVTATRRDSDTFDERVPAVGLKRVADFAVQEVSITGDTRDAGKRIAEVYQMIENAIRLAPKQGVQLAYGERTVEPLTLQNYKTLSLSGAGRPDTSRAVFLIKVPLGGAVSGVVAEKKIADFIKAVEPVGRAEFGETEDLTLSVVAPDQYRGAVADAIAADARTMAAKLGPDYGVEIEGLNRPVEWARASLSEVLLYIPYKLVVVPKR
ncbi:TonB-dependent receptor [Novosphingobium sp.]|uniref:TonB-dependent receptor n=1 Tax=Novosphingobium sp. TaxID=1874826 RepID=UPI001D4BD530|nr:TonB-dependent receptor [Novosphingobium sp.]MBX9663073.1 TonB-dependent receptor [Novosphingobium sp.]